MLRAIRKTRIYEEVVNQIHDLLREGSFKAGDQLPSERELAETFKVSRTSVREALRALETQGLIVSRTGMGNFVVDLPVEALPGPLARLLIDEEKSRVELFELRKIIEPDIAALAAERATERDVAQLKKILAEQIQAVKRGEPGVGAAAAKNRCRRSSAENGPSLRTEESSPPLKNTTNRRPAPRCCAILNKSKRLCCCPTGHQKTSISWLRARERARIIDAAEVERRWTDPAHRLGQTTD